MEQDKQRKYNSKIKSAEIVLPENPCFQDFVIIARKRSCGKVMVLHLSIILRRRGGRSPLLDRPP